MEEERAKIQIKIRHQFSVYSLLNKYAFDDGNDVLPEEEPLIKAACNKLVQALGVIDNRWKPTVFETGHSPYYVVFQDLLADQEQYNRYDDLSVREQRYLDAVMEQRIPGWHIVIADNELLQPSTEELPISQTNPTLDDVWRLFQETDRLIKQLSKNLGDIGNRLGEFVEHMVAPAVVRLFRDQGIEVHAVYPNISAKRNGVELEIDLLVVNDGALIGVECKSKLVEAHIDAHVERLGNLKRVLPIYKDHRVMGAVAGMVVEEKVAKYALMQGLYVLRQNGEQIDLPTPPGFEPAVW